MSIEWAILIEREARQGRVAYIRGYGASAAVPARLYVQAQDGLWYLQQPVEVSADGVFLGSAVLGRDKHGVYRVVAVQVAGPVKGGAGLDELPGGPTSNVLRYVVRRKDA
jgi:hypothetical protein